MDDADIAAVRRFNRTVTERIGVLEEGYLSRSRPLGASRVLWEVDSDGSPVRDLRRRLDLDSGYLSRLLGTLVGEGLVSVEPDPSDRRRRAVHLTPEGVAERQALDRDSDDLVASLLAPLTESQQRRFVDAASELERLLTAGVVTTAVEDPAGDDAQYCIDRYFAELDSRFDTGFDPEVTRSVDVEELTEPAGLIVLARLRSEPVGCGALKFHDSWAELKRLWVDPDARGLGLGRRLLVELEGLAASRGAEVVRLDTNSALHEAIAMYHSAGYVEIEPFNDEPFAHHWFEKRLRGHPAGSTRPDSPE